MSEPTKLSIEEILGIPIETKAGFYIADDPALAEWKRDSEALRKLAERKDLMRILLFVREEKVTIITVGLDCEHRYDGPDLVTAIESIKEDKP